MRQGAIVRSYHLTEYLSPVLESLKHLDGILVMNYRFKGMPETRDNTREIADSLGWKNITVLEGHGREQQEIFNRALGIFEELKYDWVWINDADEFIQKKDREFILKFLTNNSYNGGTVNVIDYTKPEERAEIRTHRPTVIVRPFVRFRETRCADYSNWYFKNIYMHHFGYMVKNTWKLRNLWYKKMDYDRVVCTKHSKCRIPDEIKELIYG